MGFGGGGGEAPAPTYAPAPSLNLPNDALINSLAGWRANSSMPYMASPWRAMDFLHNLPSYAMQTPMYDPMKNPGDGFYYPGQGNGGMGGGGQMQGGMGQGQMQGGNGNPFGGVTPIGGMGQGGMGGQGYPGGIGQPGGLGGMGGAAQGGMGGSQGGMGGRGGASRGGQAMDENGQQPIFDSGYGGGYRYPQGSGSPGGLMPSNGFAGGQQGPVPPQNYVAPQAPPIMGNPNVLPPQGGMMNQQQGDPRRIYGAAPGGANAGLHAAGNGLRGGMGASGPAPSTVKPSSTQAALPSNHMYAYKYSGNNPPAEGGKKK
jgi:hypothetical protein